MKARDAARVLAEFRPGLNVYLQGAGGEPLALGPILASAAGALDGVSITGCLLPGINRFDYAALGARLTTFMLPPALRTSFEAGSVTVRPMAYSQIAAEMASGPAPDLAVFQVTAPDSEGLCSFGPCADFAPLVASRAGRRLAFIHADLPRPRRGPTIPFASLDVAIETAGPFITGEETPPSSDLNAIADRISALVPDGAAIQSGIGGAPAAAVARLADHRGLVIRSGMVTEGYRRLDEARALDPDADHVTGLAHGSADFMAWAARRLVFADATVTHGAATLGRIPRLWAINSALEVDLFGQGNIEWREGTLVSGLGGALDFARAARTSDGGRAILALPASAAGGRISRIVPRLTAPTVSLSREDVDLVITENGVADLRAASLEGRAEALIAIAAPQHQGALETAWSEIRAKL
ncbi:MAG TPA: acetyl-CoA hydrolase/transferase C-terminal domain-containing protein [Caulobacteraceae bacterium]|nr:acetyl-CoA hydrolase/transferase C-terminal domain-containing protein [Caulobacteraceae bacterium]